MYSIVGVASRERVVYSGVFAAASARVNVVDTCSICDVCVVLDMHGLFVCWISIRAYFRSSTVDI